MVRLISELRIKMGPDRKVAIYMDNASINKCKVVKESAALIYGVAECRLLYNQPYRPE